MHAMYSSSEIDQVKTRLVRIQKDLIEMQFEFTQQELSNLYSLINRLTDLSWHQECQEDFHNTPIQSQALQRILDSARSQK